MPQTKTQVVPANSRYVPFTQQASCCAVTCIQMVMYRHNIPLLPAEELGYHFGLVVKPSKSHLFYNMVTAPQPPKAGYGTRIYLPEYEPNEIFRKLGIPFAFKLYSINKIDSPSSLLELLKLHESDDTDVMLCFNHGALDGSQGKDWGHVCVFDRVISGKVRMIDPSPDQPKWHLVSAEKLFNAMQKHGHERSAGLWVVSVDRQKN